MDERGRAVVNSNPAHWPIIVDWLSFGAVPKDPPAGLAAECEYWQLEGLLEAITPAEPEAPKFSVRPTTVDSNSAFSASARVDNFPQLLETAPSEDQTLNLPFSAVGRVWVLKISPKGVYLLMGSGRAVTCCAMTIALGTGAKAYSMTTRHVDRWVSSTSRGWPFEDNDKFQQLTHPSLLCMDGALEVCITVAFSL